MRWKVSQTSKLIHPMKKKILIWILAILLVATIINYIFAKGTGIIWNSGVSKKYQSPLKKMVIRQDSMGSGNFWKSRIGHFHEGIDLECTLGETVFAPISGTIIRKAYPYPTDKRFEGCVIQNETQEVKFFYMVSNRVGQKVKAGETIGVCQAINTKYSSAMKNHIHLEIRENGELINPETVYQIS